MSATGSSSTSTETGVTMPTALAFLVSNFQSLVTIKLTADNYLLWKTQVTNALRANGFIEYVDGTISPPSVQILDTSNNQITNPAFLKWTLIDNQLLSCLTATLSPSTLPLVLGLEHASAVWSCLQHRFNSMSRSNIHDLKRELFSFSKTGSLDAYIDEIKICAQKLSAVGYLVDDDDLVFHTLNGLPSEYDNTKTAIRAQRDLRFHEVVAILKGEEKQVNKSKDQGSSSVFLATQKLQDLTVSEASTSSANVAQGIGTPSVPVVQQASMFQPSQQPQPLQFQPPVQMFQPQFPAPFFPQPSNRFNGNNRNRPRGQGFGGFVSSSKPGCQICGKDNHTARTCHYRNTQSFSGYSGFPAVFPQSSSPSPQFPAGFSHNNMWRPQSTPQFFYPSVSQYMPMPYPQGSPQVQGPSQVSFSGYPVQFSGPLPGPPQVHFSGYEGGYSGHYTAPNSSSGGASSSFSGMPNQGFPTAFSAAYAPSPSHGPTSSTTGPSSSSNWYFDSGATNHVTPDLSALSFSQPYTAGAGVVVGNGFNNLSPNSWSLNLPFVCGGL